MSMRTTTIPTEVPVIPLRVNDLKQYVYCPRVVFYQYVMPVEKKATYKMEHGKIAEARIDELEKRRKLQRYHLDQGRRRFHVWVQSERLGLSGKLDMLIETDEALYPVDFKFTEGPPHRNHAHQICGYGLILEDMHGRPVERGFIYLIPQNKVAEIPITGALRQETLDMIEAIRAMIQREMFPDPTPYRNRCEDCEYRNYCRDIF
ncbi:MAG: CRISPR-associated protein Cas4 [Candidatus Tectomicrobia bacterium]|uniref:CRISPR-associated exonuclease Cas4 n=1 Tax=Tectimicrobiota bacterium TaxID=2528274 RepID=A0A932M1D4_UNCTE|nr:CRISPR-associated protein Cas4 [Candidatus Tectomicrobia bacterium]